MTEPDFDRVSEAPTPAPEAPGAHPADGYAPGAQQWQSPQPHLKDFLKILYKRRWLVSSIFLVSAIGTAVYTYTAVATYQAGTKLLIEVAEPNYVQFEGVVDSGAGAADYYQTQYDLLKSRSLARKTLDELKLWDDMPPRNAPQSFSLVRTVLGAVSWARGLITADAPSAAAAPVSAAAGPSESLQQSRSIDALLGMLTVAPVRNSKIVNLTARSFDPELATAVVNAHARGFIQQATEFKFQSSQEATAWLNERLIEQRTQVNAAEAALQRYREQNTAIPPEDSENITVQKLSQLNTAYTTARMARLDKEVVHNQLMAIGDNEAALEAFPAVLANATIQAQKAELATLRRNEDELLETFDINHPRVRNLRVSIESTQARMQTEIQNLVKALKTDFEASVAQETALGEALQVQKDEVLTMSQQSIQFVSLRRDLESTRTIYDNLLQRSRETGISTALRTTNVRIVDPAEVPRGPISPNRSANMMAGLFGGLLFGVVLGFLFEYLDNRIKTPDEIKAYLGVPALGLLPSVRGLDASRPYPLLNGSEWPNLTEAFRTLRTNVIFSSVEQGCRTIVVTSTGPNEGKTMVSINFGISLAEAGLRVLLLDGDMRRPKLHDVFQIDQEPGLSNLVVGDIKPSEAIKKTSVPGLWIIPAGRIPPNPAELLGSPRFLGFLKSFTEHFDWVIIDTPPVMAVVDAAIVAHAVTGVLFVVRAEAVNRYAAQTALEQLDNTRARIIGAVLNRVELDRHSYYYSQHYRKEYSSYYSTTPNTEG